MFKETAIHKSSIEDDKISIRNNSERNKVEFSEAKRDFVADDTEIMNYNKLLETTDAKMERLDEKFELGKYNAPLYANHPMRLKVIQEANKLFKNVDGYIETRNLTLATNLNKSRGHFGEIIRGIRAERAGYSVEAFGKYVNGRETDIDLLLKDKKSNQYIWLENKEVHSGISNNIEFKHKIDKMSKALDYGVLDSDNQYIRPDKAVFMNSGTISENAKEYARQKNVYIYDNVKSNKMTERILQDIKQERDL